MLTCLLFDLLYIVFLLLLPYPAVGARRCFAAVPFFVARACVCG